MSSAKRTLLMIAGMLPTLMVVVAAWMVGMSTQLIVAAFTAVCISLIITYVATIGPRRHQEAIDHIHQALDKDLENVENLVEPWRNAKPPPWTMTALTMELCTRLAERRSQLKRTMLDVTNALASLTHPLNPPVSLMPPPCPDPDDGRTLSSTYHIHLKNFQSLRTREMAFSSLMKEMPLPLIATDLELKVHYVNPATERLLAQSAANLQMMTLTKLLCEPPVALLNNDLSLPHGLGPKVFYHRLLENKVKDMTVWLRVGMNKVVPATVLVKLGQHHVFQFIPLCEPLNEGSSATMPTIKQLERSNAGMPAAAMSK